MDAHHMRLVRAPVGPVNGCLRVDAKLWQGAIGGIWRWVRAPQGRHCILVAACGEPLGCAHIQEHQVSLDVLSASLTLSIRARACKSGSVLLGHVTPGTGRHPCIPPNRSNTDSASCKQKETKMMLVVTVAVA